VSPSGKVPLLQDGTLHIWESLAIFEYLAEKFPDRQLWPQDPATRAVARSVANEMHAGFAKLREHMNMNIRKRFPGKGRTPEVLKDIERIQALWGDCRQRFGQGGPFLFGAFSIADAMYAPVCTRFITYGVDLTPVAAAYVQAITTLPAMREWIAAAQVEPSVIAQYEIYG
jgi:glutathione S-transferase